MVRKGNLAVFESSNISKTGGAMPTKFGVHAFDINPYLHEFFEPILINSIFSLPWTIVYDVNKIESAIKIYDKVFILNCIIIIE